MDTRLPIRSSPPPCSIRTRARLTPGNNASISGSVSCAVLRQCRNSRSIVEVIHQGEVVDRRLPLRAPDLFDADAMNAAILIGEALKATGGDGSAGAMIDSMEGIEFEGPKGTIFIRPEDHVAIQDMYVATLLNVDDPEAMFFEYITTTRPEPPCLLPEALMDRCGDLPYGSLTGE